MVYLVDKEQWPGKVLKKKIMKRCLWKKEHKWLVIEKMEDGNSIEPLYLVEEEKWHEKWNNEKGFNGSKRKKNMKWRRQWTKGFYLWLLWWTLAEEQDIVTYFDDGNEMEENGRWKRGEDGVRGDEREEKRKWGVIWDLLVRVIGDGSNIIWIRKKYYINIIGMKSVLRHRLVTTNRCWKMS